jgi:hypothetical protein
MVMDKTLKDWAAWGLVMVVTIGAIWPMVEKPYRVADYGREGELVVWIVNQSVEKLSGKFGVLPGRRGSVFDGNIYYPYRNVLAYSDMYFISSLWAVLPVILTHNPAVANGVLMVIGQVLTMSVVWIWWKQLTGNRWAAMAGAVALGVSQIRLHYQVHLMMWTMQYWLAALWLIWQWRRDGKGWKVIAAAGLLAGQVYESLLPVFFCGLVIAVWVIGDRKKFWGAKKLWLAAATLWVVTAGWGLKTYMGVAREFDYQRTIRDAAHFGMSIDEGWLVYGSAGLGLLTAAAVLRWKGIKNGEKKWLAIVMIMALVLALGPVLKWQEKTVKIGGRWAIPLPYAAAYYTVPGFGALRTPTRWLWLSGWAGSGLLALGVAEADKRKKQWAIAATMVVAIAGGARITKYVELPKPENYPAVYQWLEKQPGSVVVELPMGREEEEMDRMLYSLGHRKFLVNGASGFTPPERGELTANLNENFPNRNTLERLQRLKVDYIIIKKEMWERPMLSDTPVWEDGRYVVWDLKRSRLNDIEN